MNTVHEGNAMLTLPFEAIDRSMLPIAGGKAAHLGELARAGLPVPPGFCVTTTAYELVAAGTGLDPILDDLAKTRPDDTARLAELAATARAALLAARVPSTVAEAGFVLAFCQPDPLRASACGNADGYPLVSQAALDDLAGDGVHYEVVGVDRAGDDRLA